MPASTSRTRRRARSLAARPASRNCVLGGVELGLVRAAPLECGREPRTAVELAAVAAARVPVARRLGEVALQAPALGVLLEPAAQTRPLAQQRLVGDLDRSGADGQQPALGEDVEHPRDPLAALRLELVQRHAPADDRPVLALVGEAEQERARDLPLRRLQAAERVLGEPRDRAFDAARAAVGGELQLAAAALPPQLEQRRRQQRERTGLPRDVLDEGVLEVGLDAQADPLGGPRDRPPQLVARHRADQHVVRADQPRELRELGAAGVEVGAQREHDDAVAVRILRGARRARRRTPRAPARRGRR